MKNIVFYNNIFLKDFDKSSPVQLFQKKTEFRRKNLEKN